jgi:branched-chain amino acid transport system substrate-binding protein
MLFFCIIILTAVPGTSDAEDIKVGVIDCFSGPSAEFAKEALNGFKLGLSKINKQTVLGKKVKYIVRDTRLKAGRAVKLAKSLVVNKGVDILVGTTSSEVALAISQKVSKKRKVPFIVWLAKSERITGEKGHRYVFSAGDNTAMAGKVGSFALTRKPYTKFWIAGEDTEYGHAIADAVWRNLRKRRPEVTAVGSTWWKPGQPTLNVQVDTILEAKPDAAIFCIGSQSIASTLKTIKTKDMAEKLPIWMHGATEYAILKPLGEDAPEGLMGTTDYHHNFPNTQANKDFVFAYLGQYEKLPGFPAFHGYITAQFIAGAYRKAGAVDKERFVHALEGLKIKSPAGAVEMRVCDHQAVLSMFLGITKKSKKPEEQVIISKNLAIFEGKELMSTCEEITAVRTQ